MDELGFVFGRVHEISGYSLVHNQRVMDEEPVRSKLDPYDPYDWETGERDRKSVV